jgi:hypothetical protein
MAYPKKRTNNGIQFIKPIIGLLLCMLIRTELFAQTITIHHPQLQYLFEDSLLKRDNYHSALKPLVVSAEMFDSVMGCTRPFKQILTHFPFRIAPVLEASANYNGYQKDMSIRLGQGITLSGNLGKKAGFELSAVLYEERFSALSSAYTDSLSLIPRFNRPLWVKDKMCCYALVRGSIYWRPLQWLTFRTGNDKNFIGDGIRSFLLSENADAYPFFQTRLNIWKINYSHQVMFLRDLVPGLGSKRFTKYSSQHTFSLNATKRLNVYIFEAVVWRKQDSLRYRGFDMNYLNPFLFFRPVEFNMGSPDNVLMGIGGKWRIGGKSFIYGQLMLDEFRLQEIKANNGWWGNKYAYQIGFKTYSIFKNHKSMLVAEYNHCRPYTYAHTYSLQNYGYLTQSLAHPQGSNFREAIAQFYISLPKRWFVRLEGQFIRFGSDPAGKNMGSDMYKPQWTHPNNNGNYIGQGTLNHQLSGALSVSRMLIPEWRLQGFISGNLTFRKTGTDKDFFPIVQAGISTLLYEND